MIYPKGHVNKFGAKAGILMYVKENLPDIPQVDMVVKTPEMSIKEALTHADNYPILWPRILRSSAAVELDGYEGFFPTEKMDGFEEGSAKIWNPNYRGPYSNKEFFDEYVYNTISRIENSPSWYKDDEPKKYAILPDKISVIIAEQSPSEITGTYIKNPNQDDVY